MKLRIYRIFLYIFNFMKRIRKKGCSKNEEASLEKIFIFNRDAIENENIEESIIIFSSAIGEFNAIKPFINSYLEDRKNCSLIILSHDPQYSDTYHSAYPNAIVGIMPAPIPALFDDLVKRTKPHIVAIAEGPCLFCHFPLRLDLSLSTMCLFHNIPLIILNATPWPKQFISRIYKIEYFLFRDLFKQAVTAWFTPYPDYKEQLSSYGIPEDRISIVGDMKYDVLFDKPLTDPDDELAFFLDSYRETPEQPLIVAGSVSSFEEQVQIISAWEQLREKYPKAKLILAPRQINQHEAMVPLREYLKNSTYKYSYRSDGEKNVEEAGLLILDVYGELMHFYNISSICYIGRNHGVLEPLKFNKPTLVGPTNTWDQDKPTYLMYQRHIEARSIEEVPDMKKLGATFIELFKDISRQKNLIKKSQKIISEEIGATRRVKKLIQNFIKE
ncbi:MAG: hypothetical protein L3J50_04545 [Emcibacter sp.]|nr:hypothetical protein [Emcibacter sp.]